MRAGLTPALSGVVFSISALMLAGCGDPKAVSPAGSAPHVVMLNGDDQPLREDFNRDQGFVRLMLVVDPRCPECLRGLADMGDDVLTKLPKDARIKVYVVHEPVIGGREIAAHDSRATLLESDRRFRTTDVPSPRSSARIEFGLCMGHLYDLSAERRVEWKRSAATVLLDASATGFGQSEVSAVGRQDLRHKSE